MLLQHLYNTTQAYKPVSCQCVVSPILRGSSDIIILKPPYEQHIVLTN